MKRLLKFIAAGFVAGLIAAAIAACGGTTTTTKTVATPAVTTTQTQTQVQTQTQTPTTPSVAVTPAQIVNALPPATVLQFCNARTQGLAAGDTDAQIEAAFAKGYDKKLVAGMPPAADVYNALIAHCVGQ